MSTEDRLRQALRAEADRTPAEPDPDGVTRILAAATDARRRRRARRVAGAGVAAALVAAGVFAFAMVANDDSPTRVETVPAEDPTTTIPPSPSTTTTDLGHVVWPAPGDDRTFDDPLDAARAFGVEYLGMAEPLFPFLVDQRPTTAAIVDLVPGGEGGSSTAGLTDGPSTRVQLAAVDGSWAVTSAASSHLVVDTPAEGGPVAPPATVTGRGRGFEGAIVVEVRDAAGEVVGRATTQAGALADLEPFSVQVPFDPPPTEEGAIVVLGTSGIEGTPEATVVPVWLFTSVNVQTRCIVSRSTDEPGPDEMDVDVFLPCGDDFVAVPRRVARTTAVLRTALEQLLAGPTPQEQTIGLTGMAPGADALLDVTITDGGTAVVELAPDVGSLSEQALGQLDRTVLQFPTVQGVVYYVGGECFDTCEPRTEPA